MSESQMKPEPQGKTDPAVSTNAAPPVDLMAVFSKTESAVIERGKPADPAKADAKRAEPPEIKDEMRELVLAMAKLAPNLSKGDPELVRTIQALAKEVQTPGKTEESVFRTRASYAFQDVEKQDGRLDIRQGLRTEMAERAADYPLLQNDRMRDLLAQTGALAVESLVRELRKEAISLAGKADQNTPAAMDRIAALENRVRLSPRVAENSPKPERPAEPLRNIATPQTEKAPAQASVQVDGREQGPIAASAAGAAPSARAGGFMMGMMNALPPPEPDAPGPWDRQLTPIGGRFTAYTARMQDGAHEQSFRGAEASGQAALSAMREFSEGPGAAIMSKIRDAAKADPGGMSGVLSEMREGGKYAELRQTFNATLEKEKGVAAAYDRATSAVAKFGVDRTDVETIAQARPDTAAITGRFQKLDADIGKAASMLPGKTDGKSFTEELAEKAQEIVKKAVEAVQSIFAKLRPSSGPSPN